MTRISIRPMLLVIAVFVGSLLLFGIGFALFWDHAMSLREANSDTESGFVVTDQQFARLRVLFWALFGGAMLVPLAVSTLVARASGLDWRWAAASLGLITVVLGLLLLPWLEFVNSCEVGQAFVFETSC